MIETLGSLIDLKYFLTNMHGPHDSFEKMRNLGIVVLITCSSGSKLPIISIAQMGEKNRTPKGPMRKL